jgi:hypothetical protein
MPWNTRYSGSGQHRPTYSRLLRRAILISAVRARLHSLLASAERRMTSCRMRRQCQYPSLQSRWMGRLCVASLPSSRPRCHALRLRGPASRTADAICPVSIRLHPSQQGSAAVCEAPALLRSVSVRKRPEASTLAHPVAHTTRRHPEASTPAQPVVTAPVMNSTLPTQVRLDATAGSIGCSVTSSGLVILLQRALATTLATRGRLPTPSARNVARRATDRLLRRIYLPIHLVRRCTSLCPPGGKAEQAGVQNGWKLHTVDAVSADPEQLLQVRPSANAWLPRQRCMALSSRFVRR